MCLANTHKALLFKAIIYVGDSPVISRDADINNKHLKTLTFFFWSVLCIKETQKTDSLWKEKGKFKSLIVGCYLLIGVNVSLLWHHIHSWAHMVVIPLWQGECKTVERIQIHTQN